MSWHPSFDDLQEALASLYPSDGDVNRLVDQVGLLPHHIDLDGSPITVWHRILQEAVRHHRLEVLIDFAYNEYPEYDPLLKAVSKYKAENQSPDLTESLSTIVAIPFLAPRRVPHFTGRQEIITRLTHLLTISTEQQVVGLVGMGGIGKSALAIHMAHILKNQFPDGVLWADLSASTVEAELVSFAIPFGQADTIGKQVDLVNKAEFLRGVLASKRLLVVIDNAEESQDIDLLVPDGPENRILITSRNRKVFVNLDTVFVEAFPFHYDEAVSFLSKVIGAKRVATEPMAAQQLVKLVDGLPLALSIIAGYLSDSAEMSLTDYVDLLKDEQTRLQYLTEWEDNERNVRATFQVSFLELPSNVQTLFASLAVFDGPDFSSMAVAAVNKIPLPIIKRELGRLSSLSLVSVSELEQTQSATVEQESKHRYRLHALLKSFALEKLGDQAAELRRLLAIYYADLADKNRTQNGYLLLDIEWQNIVAALQWAYTQHEWSTLARGGLGLTQNYVGQMGYMDARGYWSEARKLLSWANEELDRIDNPIPKARILTNLGGFAVRQADFDVAIEFLQTALTLLDASHDLTEILAQKLIVYEFMYRAELPAKRKTAQQWLERGIIEAQGSEDEIIKHLCGYLHIQLSSILTKAGKSRQAIKTAETGLALLPITPTPAKVSGLNNLAIAYQYLAQNQKALEVLSEAVPLAQALGDIRRMAGLLGSMAWNERRTGHWDKAIQHYLEALTLYQRTGDIRYVTATCVNLGVMYIQLNDDQEAIRYLKDAIDLAETHRFSEMKAFAQANLAELHLCTGQPDQAQAALMHAYQLCQTEDIAYLLPTVIRQRAEIALAQNRLEEGLDLIDQAVKLTQANEDAEEKGIAWRVKGRLLNKMHRGDEAVAAWQQSLQCLTDQDLYELAKTRLIVAETVLKGENIVITVEQAKGWLREILTTFTNLGAQREMQQAQALIELYTAS